MGYTQYTKSPRQRNFQDLRVSLREGDYDFEGQHLYIKGRRESEKEKEKNGDNVRFKMPYTMRQENMGGHLRLLAAVRQHLVSQGTAIHRKVTIGRPQQ